MRDDGVGVKRMGNRGGFRIGSEWKQSAVLGG